MPLPVEKSAGKVSSLVARWQTAANKEQENAARQRDSESRRSSMTSQASRRSSVDHSVKPSPRVEGSGTLPDAKENGDVIEELKDLDIEDHVKVEGDRPDKKVAGLGDGNDKKQEAVEDGKDVAKPAPEPHQAIDESAKSPPSTLTTTPKAKGTEVKVESPKARTNPAPKKAAETPSPVATKKTEITPSKIPTPTGGKLPSSTSSVRTRTTSGSSRIPQPIAKSSPTAATPQATKSGSVKSQSAVMVEKKSEKASGPKSAPTAKTSIPSKSTSTQNAPATTSRTATAQTKTPSTATKSPRPAPTSFTRPTPSTSKLTPSHTGPSKRASSLTPGSTSISPTPLRPQITGTPSKHTASSLAKAKEASEKRKSLSLGKSSGQVARASIGGLKGEVMKPKSTPTPKAVVSPPVKTTAPSSGSRLLQGTASSRAKAAAAQPASPTRAKFAKPSPSGSTPVKPTPTQARAKVPSTPAKSNDATGPVMNGTTKISHPASSSDAPELKSDIDSISPVNGGQSVVPRTPSPTRQIAASDTEVEGEVEHPQTPGLSTEDVTSSSTEPGRAAIIGRVGLAGAREAPASASTSNEADQSLPIETKTEQPIGNVNEHNEANGDNVGLSAQASSGADENTTLLNQVDPRDIDANGQVEEPEVSRSSTNPFGRIGHPGAGAKTNELETPNPGPASKSSQTKGTEEKNAAGKIDIKWHEEELKRDPGKTIVSPDANKGK